jgi:hypothetical protein
MTEPEAPAVPVRGREVWSWVVPCCPLCGREHWHGGGELGGDPRRLLGHRVAHCGEEDVPPHRLQRGYVLVESAEKVGRG